MNWSALILVVAALSLYSPFANQVRCVEPSCCAQMEACCGHCTCPAQQSCSVAKPVPIDQQVVATHVQIPPRVQLELFTLCVSRISTLPPDRHPLAYPPESPPLKLAQTPQARLCVWLI